MSLIACTMNYNFPFVIGDLLISSEIVMENIRLPNFTEDIEPHLRPENPLRPIALNQKTYIIKQNVSIALAGDVAEMANLLSELKIRCGYYENIKEEHIRKFLDDYNLDVNFAQSAFFMLLIEHGGSTMNVKQFWYPLDKWRYTDNDTFQAAYAIGSGKDVFISQLNQEAKVETTAGKEDIRRAIATNIGFITRLIAVEKVTLGPVIDNWGAGYEIIFYNGQSFEKISQFAFVVNICGFYDDGDIPLPRPNLILYYKYHNDILYIISLEIKGGEGKEENGVIMLTSRNFITRIFLALPIDRKEPLTSNDFPDDFSFQTNQISLGYAVIKDNGNTIYPSCFADSSNIEVIFKDGETLEIRMPTEIHEKIRAGVKEVYPNLS